MNVHHPPENGKAPTDPPSRSDQLLADIQATLQRFADAQGKRRVAGLTALDNAAYQWELAEAAGEEREAAYWFCDLLLLLIRYAGRMRPEALARALARAAWPELVGEFEDLARRVLAEELPGLLAELRKD